MLKESFYKFNSLFLVLKRLYHPTRDTLVLNIHKISISILPVVHQPQENTML